MVIRPTATGKIVIELNGDEYRNSALQQLNEIKHRTLYIRQLTLLSLKHSITIHP